MTLAENVLKHGTGGLNIDDCRFAYGDPCWVGPQTEDLNGGGYNTNKTSTKKKDSATSYYTNVLEREFVNPSGRWPANIYQCPKASRSEREAGLEHLELKTSPNNLSGGTDTRLDGNPVSERANFHPTVKPIGVMRWLCRLITPPGGTVLDPFLGSGTTAVSACLEGKFNAIGCEMTEDYWPIIEGRIEWAKRGRENGSKE